MDETCRIIWKIKREAVTDKDGNIDREKRRKLKSEIQEQFEDDIETTLSGEEAAEPATIIMLCTLVLTSIQAAISVKEHLESRDETEKVEVVTSNGYPVEIAGSNGETTVEITTPDGETETITVER